MTPEPVTITSAPARRPPFDPVTIAFHWTTLAGVLGLFTAALLIDRAPDPATAGLLLTTHRSLGVTVWTLTVLRLSWRLTRATLPPWPQTMKAPQRVVARINEYGLYGLLLAQPVTGVLQTLYRGKAFDLLIWRVPALMPRDRAMVHLTEGLHTAGALLLAGLVGLHAAAGLYHLFVARDGVFESMAPVARRPAAAPQAGLPS
jgi:cytochrome b561